MATDVSATSTATTSPSATSTLAPIASPAHSASPVVAFIIGFFIIIMASLLNAGGLNLTKMDHVRTMSLPKSSRKKDYLRPLWVLGMLLYVMSQLIGSSLALEYMRAEYVAPLGSSSLVFNFMFASILIGTPITRMDLYGTIVVILGVIGIVGFGSINSGLKEYFDYALLSHLWGRAGWIIYFIVMTSAIVIQYICNTQLEAVYLARSEISVLPSSTMPRPRGPARASSGSGGCVKAAWHMLSTSWERAMTRLRELMEGWTANKDDKTIAWTLGIGWACGGGAMAGGSLVFAKATVKLISGSLNHTNTGNQFVHFAAILTFLLLATSAVFQIICLNRGLKIYDSTLVVPTFYAVYTATGWLNSLVFMDEVDAYSNWTLFAIFCSICILISGVVLLTSKKPEPNTLTTPTQPGGSGSGTVIGPVPRRAKKGLSKAGGTSISSSSPILGGHDDDDLELGEEEDDALRPGEGHDDEVMWQIGDDDSDNEDAKHAAAGQSSGLGPGRPERSLAEQEHDEFGEWEDGGKAPTPSPPR